jgi:hypothetical protein
MFHILQISIVLLQSSLDAVRSYRCCNRLVCVRARMTLSQELHADVAIGEDM